MSALAHDGRMIGVLWRRDLLLFLRQKSRIVGALAQPLLFWLAFGAGMAPTFRIPNEPLGYMAYSYPGIVVMLVLFAAISATMSVIDDRHQGFLQGVLAAPGSRTALVLGKVLGSSTVAMIQAVLLLLLAPLAKFPLGSISWTPLLVVLGLTTVALTGLGFALAWWLDSSQAYHVVMAVALVPMWMLSGALFPPAGLPPVLAQIVLANPMTYAVAGIRRALHGGTLPQGTGIAGVGAAGEIAVIAGFAFVCLGVAVWAAGRRGVRS